ncbi:MAG: alpha-amylase family protein [Chthoniobacterales bacterium]
MKKTILTLSLLCSLTAGECIQAATWKVEAEKAGDGLILSAWKSPGADLTPQQSWKVKDVAEASEGKMLMGPIYPGAESKSIPVVIPKAGVYKVWVRHYTTPGKFTSFIAIFRDEIGAVVNFHDLDFKPLVMTSKSSGELKPPPAVAPAAPVVPPVLTWSEYDITFEHPMKGTLSFSHGMGVTGGTMGVDCVVLSDDKAFDPTKADLTKIAADGGELQPPTPPPGMQPAPIITPNSSFFGSITDPNAAFQLAYINAAVIYRDYAWEVQLGANLDHGWFNGSKENGIRHVIVANSDSAVNALIRSTPAPTGRFVNAEGRVAGIFSYSYEPYRKAFAEDAVAGVAYYKDDDLVQTFRISDEGSGYFDYSDPSRDAYHKFLAQRFTSIDKLNALWNSQYKSFDEVPLPKTPKESENKANWFSFREFCGLQLVTLYAETAKAIKGDPHHRHATGQSSCLSINSPEYTASTPMDYEELVNIGFAGEKEFGMDAYSGADSFCGADIDFIMSLDRSKRMVNSEFNVHSHDPRNMSQAYWNMVGKGIKGMQTWTFQSTPNMWMYDMWALQNPDGTPRDKLGPIADGNAEIHRMERILSPAKPEYPVKPVAILYSRLDLALPQPTMGIYSTAVDSPYRIYSVLRGLGYTVTWITPKQIEAGGLKDIGAVVMLGANHVPKAATDKLSQWVKDGGCLIGDQWPAAFDEYDRTQDTLLTTMGIEPVGAKKATAEDLAKARAAKELNTTPVGGGMDADVLRTLNAEELFKRAEEEWAQWDSTNPVSLATGNWHLSGFDLKRINVLSGEIIGMGMGGHQGIPAMVINTPGKGHTLYSAIMLGTLFEGGPIGFDWDASREGPGVPRILGAFLKYSGVQPYAENGLRERIGWGLRIEAPLKDPKGNIFIGMTNMNVVDIPSFPVTLKWINPKPKMLVVITGGSRQMTQIPFTLKDGELKFTMLAFDTSASVIALNNSEPLVSLDISGATRGVANLLDVTPNTKLKVKVTVWNPSPTKLAAGQVNFFTVPGWFSNAGDMKVPAIDAFGHQEVTFEVQAPALCTKKTLRPLVFKYAADKITSTPCTEIMWWNNPVQAPVALSKN